MSTPVPERCENCDNPAQPTDSRVAITDTRLVVRFWRYDCACGRVWANALQRMHNHQAWRQAVAEDRRRAYLDD